MSNFKLRDSSGKVYKGWYVLLTGILLMTFGYSCVVSVSGIFILPVTTELGIQIGNFSIWITIMSVVSIIFLSVISRVFSKKNIKKIMIICCLFGVVGFIGFATARSLVQFYIFAAFLGICFGGLTTTPCSLLTTNWFGPKLRGKALGILFGGNSIVIMGVIPLLNYLVQTFGWRIAYWCLAGALVVICLPLTLKFAVWSPAEMGVKRIGDIAEEEIETANKNVHGMTFNEGLKHPSSWVMFISGSLLCIASSAILVHSQPFMIMHGYSATFAANVVSIMIGICVITCMFVGLLNDKFGLRGTALFSGIAFVCAYIAQIYIPNGGIFMVILFIIGYGLGCPSVNVISPLLANYIFGEKEVGAFIGYVNLFIGIGGAIGSALVGKLYDITGTYIIPFWICTGILVLMVILRLIITAPRFNYQNR